MSLENELADPTNPQLNREREEDNVDPGELIRGLVDVRSRLDKIRKGKEGRGKLVGIVTGNTDEKQRQSTKLSLKVDEVPATKASSLVDIDRRLGGLEKLVGSSSASLDEVGSGFDSERTRIMTCCSFHRFRPLCCHRSHDSMLK